jgi:hypothetical protein
MRRDEAIQVPSPIAILVRGIADHHHLQDAQQFLRHLEVALIAGLMKWDQDLVGQPPDVWRHPAPRGSWFNDNSLGRP